MRIRNITDNDIDEVATLLLGLTEQFTTQESSVAAAEFSVNSPNYAVPVYVAMGFVRTEPTRLKNGIYYNPMKLDGRHSG